MHKTIDKNLVDLMARNGINQAELARLSNVGQPTISRILKPFGPKGIKEPTDKQVRPLAEHFGVSTDQLRGYAPLDDETGGDKSIIKKPSSSELFREMLARNSKLPEHLKQKIMAAARVDDGGGILEVDYYRPGAMGDEVWIAHYDVRAAMGGGQIPHDYPEMFQDVRVSPQHLREMGVEFKEHFHLKMVTVGGNRWRLLSNTAIHCSSTSASASSQATGSTCSLGKDTSTLSACNGWGRTALRCFQTMPCIRLKQLGLMRATSRLGCCWCRTHT